MKSHKSVHYYPLTTATTTTKTSITNTTKDNTITIPTTTRSSLLPPTLITYSIPLLFLQPRTRLLKPNPPSSKIGP